MPFWPPPPRHRGVEILDDPSTPEHERLLAMAYLPLANALFGGRSAFVDAILAVVDSLTDAGTLIDVGTGMGDLADLARGVARHEGKRLHTIGLDSVHAQARAAVDRVDNAVVGDGRSLPFADGAADVVICSQTLHHFFDDDPVRLIREMHRVSKDWVIISDLRRSRVAAAAYSAATWVLRFPEITRKDGVTSVMRGFTADELSRLVREATGVRPTIRESRFWRLTATWRKSPVR